MCLDNSNLAWTNNSPFLHSISSRHLQTFRSHPAFSWMFSDLLWTLQPADISEHYQTAQLEGLSTGKSRINPFEALCCTQRIELGALPNKPSTHMFSVIQRFRKCQNIHMNRANQLSDYFYVMFDYVFLYIYHACCVVWKVLLPKGWLTMPADR